MGLVMDRAALQAFLVSDFAQVADDFGVEHVGPEGLILRLRVGEKHLRHIGKAEHRRP